MIKRCYRCNRPVQNIPHEEVKPRGCKTRYYCADCIEKLNTFYRQLHYTQQKGGNDGNCKV